MIKKKVGSPLPLPLPKHTGPLQCRQWAMVHNTKMYTPRWRFKMIVPLFIWSCVQNTCNRQWAESSTPFKWLQKSEFCQSSVTYSSQLLVTWGHRRANLSLCSGLFLPWKYTVSYSNCSCFCCDCKTLFTSLSRTEEPLEVPTKPQCHSPLRFSGGGGRLLLWNSVNKLTH